jgi:hypothetical protein
MTNYSQNDPRWKGVLLGFNSDYRFTIGSAGCYVTAIADVCSWAGNELNSLQVNQICMDNKWFIDGGVINRDDIPAILCQNLQYLGRTNWSKRVDMSFFDDASDPNIAYIVLIDASPANGMQTHYTMVWSKLNANDLEINDSWDGVRRALSRYGDPATILYSAMKFRKITPPAPAPAAPAYSVSVDPIDKQVIVAPGHSKWNLDQSNFDAIVANPVGGSPDGPITVRGLLRRSDVPDYAYYLEDPNAHQGYNTLDCADYTPPPPPVYTPPAAPLPTPMARKYKTTVVLPVYASEAAARALDVSVAFDALPVGEYYVFTESGKALLLGSDNQHQDQAKWINTLDDVVRPVPVPIPEPKPEPVPAPTEPVPDSATKIAASYKWFFQSHKPVTYKIRKDYTVREYVHGRRPITIRAGKKIDIYGAFQADGKTYLRPMLDNDLNTHYYYYGIETSDILSGLPNLEDSASFGETLQNSWEWVLERALHPVQTLEGIFRIKIK